MVTEEQGLLNYPRSDPALYSFAMAGASGIFSGWLRSPLSVDARGNSGMRELMIA